MADETRKAQDQPQAAPAEAPKQDAAQAQGQAADGAPPAPAAQARPSRPAYSDRPGQARPVPHEYAVERNRRHNEG